MNNFVSGPRDGLDDAAVRDRVLRGEVNEARQVTSRTVGQIVRANVLTPFNGLLGTLFVVILVVGAPADALFGVVLVANTAIGIYQELRAKRTLDRLAVLTAPRARVVRVGRVDEIPVGEVVLDDLLDLRPGDQIVVDGTVVLSEGLEVDESLLSGELEPLVKEAGAELQSGSFVAAGTGRFRATRVGPAAYAATLAEEAKRFTRVRSELRDGINRLLRFVTWAIVPTAAVLLVSQFRLHDSVRAAVSGAVAGTVGMVPEGLVLLTTVAFAVAVVRLARRGPGPRAGGGRRSCQGGRAVYRQDRHLDRDAYPPPQRTWKASASVPFSSARKWSGTTFVDRETWVMGAPEVCSVPAREPTGTRRSPIACEPTRRWAGGWCCSPVRGADSTARRSPPISSRRGSCSCRIG